MLEIHRRGEKTNLNKTISTIVFVAALNPDLFLLLLLYQLLSQSHK